MIKRFFILLLAIVASVGMNLNAAQTITVGALEHGSVVASPTSAEAGTTITLTATPEAGYKLNTIEATYFGAANETLGVTNKKNVGRGITAEYNKSNYIYVSSYDGAYNLTVSTNDGTNLIKKIEIEFYGPGVNDARTNSMLSSDHGSWTFEDGDPCTKATINNINAVSVVLSGSGTGMNQAWSPKAMKVYYDGDVLIDLTDTENANVKTFTMVNKAVNVFAEFIPTGSCGENLTWEYSPSTGALVISGTGAMSDYDNNMNKAPWYAYRESISSISLPDGLTYIGKHAFRECNNFTQLVVPNSVTEIGNTAFQDCSKLWNLTLPNTLEKIGGAALERTKISNFTIPEGVTSLDGYVFGECTSLYRVNIHAGVTSLTGNVFYNCTKLNTIYCYVENPVAITDAVFEGVNKANCKLYVPFTSMAAYQAADEWKDFFIKPIPGTAPTLYLDIDGASATLIYGYPEDSKPAYSEEYAQWNNLEYDYRNDNLKTITIDASCRENVMTSFKNLFQYFQALETIRNMAYLSTANVTNMEGMFEYCRKLTELDLHTFNTAKVTNMKNMFATCDQLVMLDISSFNTSLVTTMYYMFANDDKLEHIYVGEGWNTDNVTESLYMFRYCGKLPNYNYNYNNHAKAYVGDGGYLTALTQIGAWESGDCDVILYSNGRMSVTKKAGNGNGAMANYANKDAQPWADYRNLVTKLDVEDGVKEIGTCAFYDFREMTQLNISEGVTAIHENAFRNGIKLTILILPSTLRVLGDQADAFTSCPITDIYLTAHPARLTWNEDNDDFIYSYSNPDVHKTTVCHVPANLADAYVAKFITGVEADKQPNVTFEGGMPAVDMITPEDVIALISEIGEVAYTAESKAKIDAAREAFDGLSDEDKAQVTNLTTLTDAETTYNNLKTAAEQAAADVEALINAIGTAEYTAESKAKIDAAREAYDALDGNVKLLVTNYTVLTDAEVAYEKAKTDKEAADPVIDKINNIPTPVELKLATRDSIQNARAAYDALNAAQQALVSNYQTLTDAEAALEAYISIPDGALNGKFTINAAGDVISFAKGNLQATTADLGEHWTWGVAANQWEVIGAEVANTAIIGSGKVSANGTVDMFGWSTPATYFGIYHTMDGKDYLGDFVDWGTNLGAGWRTLTKDEWGYLLKTRENAANLRGQATVNGVYGMILLPNDWTTPTGLTFTAMPNNWITNVYADADWTAMEEAGAVFLPIEGTRWEQSLYYTDGGSYWSSTPAEDAQSAEYVLVNEETPILGGVEWLMDYGGRDNGISVRLAAFSVNPFDDAQAVKDMIDALPNPIDYFSKDAIKAARAAYDALGNETKAALDEATVQHLIDAENQWAAIAAKIEQNVYYIGKDGELKNEKVALLNIPDPAPDFNGYEFDKWKVKTGRFLEEGLRIKALYTPIITTDPVAYDTLVFNRADQELVVAGIAKEGHIEYRIGEGEWSAELPKAMNAGTYVVTYKLVRDGHEDYLSPNQISVTIAKTQVAFDAPAAYDTLTYNYNAQTLIAAGQTLDGTFEYTLDPTDAQSWSTELPQGMNAGLYGVNFRVIGDMNHFDSIVETPIEILIAKRDIIVTAPAAYDTLVYNAQAQTLAIDGTADFNTMEYTLTPNDDNSWLTVMPTAKNAGSYDVYYRVPGDANHNDFEPQHIAATIAQAPLTITAIDSTIIYGDQAPEFFASYSGWQGEDTEDVVSGLAYTCAYEQGSYVGTYAITPNSATSLNYVMTFVEGTLTVVKAAVYVSDAEVHIAKFEDNNTDAEVTDKGVLNGVKLNDPVDHITTASFSSADVAEHLTITLFYELTGDSALLENYYLSVTSEVYTEEGVIIEQMLPDNDHQPGETEQVEVKEGIDVYMFGYCDGSGNSVKYHLNRGIPDQYMIDFKDSRFTDVDWTNLDTPGKDGTIFVEIPADLPTGDYNMSVQFRDSRFDWLESRQFNVTFHVNLPETYTMPLFGNAIALVDTCNCFTDIQWYYRATPSDVWEPIPGATGYYCHVDNKLTGEYFVKAKMNGVETFTCPQTDMETLYEDDIKHAKVRAYPNPVVTTTTVTIENSTEWNHNIRIVNLMGAEVMNATFEGDKTSVEMSGYPQGNYMISVDGIVVKVMKQ